MKKTNVFMATVIVGLVCTALMSMGAGAASADASAASSLGAWNDEREACEGTASVVASASVNTLLEPFWDVQASGSIGGSASADAAWAGVDDDKPNMPFDWQRDGFAKVESGIIEFDVAYGYKAVATAHAHARSPLSIPPAEANDADGVDDDDPYCLPPEGEIITLIECLLSGCDDEP